MNKSAVREYLFRQLPIDEGIMLRVYPDSKNIPTVGIGRNLLGRGLTKSECDYLGIPYLKGKELVDRLTIRGITKQEAFYLLNNDIEEILQQITDTFDWMQEQPDVVWGVLANMVFNMGIQRVKRFVKTLELIKNKEYEKASVEMLNSQWYADVSARAERLSTLLKTA